jgi:hypothetical protein
MATNRRQQIRLSPDEQTAFFRERRKAAPATIDKDGFPHVVAKMALMIAAGDEYAELRGVTIRGRCEILEDEASVRAAFEARARTSSSSARSGSACRWPTRWPACGS